MSVAQSRMEFEQVRDSILDRNLQSLDEAVTAFRTAAPLFELGVKLGKDSSPEAEELILEIKTYVEERRKQLIDATRHSSKKAGG